nr:HAMP domain-containing sensor histidine kinase [uncultured Cohaesibacter sp.]
MVSGILHGQARKKPGVFAAFLAGLVKFSSAGISIAWSLGGAETDGLFEYSYWIAVALFTPLMAFSIMQKARSIDRIRQETTSLRIARRAERAARDLVKIRTSELEAAKEMAELALVAEQEGQAEQLRFIDVVRHQYQTPLSVIRTSLASLRHALPKMNDANRLRMNRIDSAVTDLVQLLDSSLQKSRMRGTELIPDAQPVALEAFLEEIIEHNETLHAGRKFVLEWEGSILQRNAVLDSAMVGMALQNLIDNSVKFSSADTIVKLKCSINDAMFIVSVEDDGIGIPCEEIRSVGKRFFRASNAGGVAGTGLGLHIVKSVAIAHDGDFEIANKPAGGVVASLSLRLTSQVQ